MASVLELDLSPGRGDGRYVVSVISSPTGEAVAEVAFDPYSVARDLPGLQQALLASSVPSRRLVGTGEGLVREVGRRLFDALFAQDVSRIYRTSSAVADERGELLRIVLRFGAPELATLPWESLFDPTTDSFVSRREPLVRYLPVPSSPPPMMITLPLRILALVSSPRGLPSLDIEKERDNLNRAVAPLAAQGLVSVEWIDHTTWASLHDSLIGGSWHVVHFIGHGDFDDANDEGVLALENERGSVHRIAGEAFVDLLRDAQPMPRLVFLNACNSAAAGQADLFSGTAAALVRGGVNAVTAMQFEISDQAAIAFSRGFYTAVGRGRGVDDAVKSGRVAILGVGEGSLEWITPTLHLRGRETQLFESGSSQAAQLSVIELRARAAAAVEAQDAATAVPLLDSVLAAAPDDVTAQRDRDEVRASDRPVTTPKRDREGATDAGRSAPPPQLLRAAEEHSCGLQGAEDVSARAWKWMDDNHEQVKHDLRRYIDAGDVEWAYRLASATGRYWWTRDYYLGREFLNNVLDLPYPEHLASVCMSVLAWRGRIALRLDRPDEAQRDFNEVLEFALSTHDALLEAETLNDLSIRAFWGARAPHYAEYLARQAIAILVTIPDSRAVRGRADALDNLGTFNKARGRYREAQLRYIEATTLYEPGTQSMAWVDVDLAGLYVKWARAEDASCHVGRALKVAGAIQDHGMKATAYLESGRLAKLRGDYPAAAEAFETSSAICTRIRNYRLRREVYEEFSLLADTQ